MNVKSEFPYFEVQFDKDGSPHVPAQVKALKAALKPGGPTDLLLISHGWNNGMEEAKEFYQKFLDNFSLLKKQGMPGFDGRRFAVVGVLWPSKKFAESTDIAGGAASRGGLPAKKVTDTLDSFKDFFPGRGAASALKKAKTLIPDLENDPKARKKFADLIRGLVTKEPPKRAEAKEDAVDRFLAADGEDLFDLLKVPPPVDPRALKAASDGAAGQGGAAGFNLFSDMKASAMRLLNLTTYYEMKARAGKVGREGVAPLLRTLKSQVTGLKIHLVGHSFGGRLVTASTWALKAAAPNKALPIDSLCLLQAAFSHNGFSPDFDKGTPGAFRAVIADKLVKGPIIITHTKNDSAVGTAYPLASRLAREAAAALGDKDDKFGGIGRNGAQKTPEAVDLDMVDVGKPYDFRSGRIHNLLGDKFIRHHSDIDDKEPVYAVMSAISRT